jgi:hypothetical protein
MAVSIHPSGNHDLEPLAEYDTGMGTNFETIRDELLDEVMQTAERRDINYNPNAEDYQVFFEKETSRAVMYAESWGGAPEILAEVTAFECTMRTEEHNKCLDEMVGRSELETALLK